jgi:hypothetical protein
MGKELQGSAFLSSLFEVGVGDSPLVVSAAPFGSCGPFATKLLDRRVTLLRSGEWMVEPQGPAGEMGQRKPERVHGHFNGHWTVQNNG